MNTKFISLIQNFRILVWRIKYLKKNIFFLRLGKKGQFSCNQRKQHFIDFFYQFKAKKVTYRAELPQAITVLHCVFLTALQFVRAYLGFIKEIKRVENAL
jgi:hypothetical protein